jgi:2-C-methyl-D-erythritol 4-phosphate cytidylyltransferase
MVAMYQGYRIGGVYMMGGSGARFGSPVPKQFALLGGKPLYCHALDTFLKSGVFDEIVLVRPPNWHGEIAAAPTVRMALGGATRQESSRAGLSAFEKEPDFVLIHDAVRPFVTEEMILANLDAAIAYGAANTCIPTADTLVIAPKGDWIDAIPKREEFLRGQTPQTFRYDLIVRAHREAKERGFTLTDDCGLIIAIGEKVAVVKGSEENLKITTPLDLKVAEALLAIREKVKKGEGDDRRPEQEGRINIPARKRSGH